MAENAGAHDFYNGGAGFDTLQLEFTATEWENEGVQSDIAAFNAFLATATPGARFDFNAFDLTVVGFEALRVLVDGVESGTIDHPVDAVDDANSVSENGSVSGHVLTNDSVPDGPPGVTLVPGPPAGALTLNPDGSFSFDPNFAYDFLAAGESTLVSFSYQVTDADGDNDAASVAITIGGENDDPVFFGGITSGAIAEDGFTSTIGSVDFLDVDLSDAHTRSILSAGPD